MKYQFQFLAFFVSILAAFLIACTEIVPCDNQINLPPPIQAVVNPTPVKRNFLYNNKSHKVLVAIVDTGVDYNHPNLVDSIHFDLNRNNQPTRLGWDFIGQDGWPSPCLGRRTVNFDFELDLIDKLVEQKEKFASYFDKKRNIVQEYLASVWHGTSMAGLIVQDIKNIGLLPYRVVPPNTNSAGEDYVIQIIENILSACRKAIEDCAHIVVMTSFFHFDDNDSPRSRLIVRRLKNEFERLLKSNHDILFVVSAGNGHGYQYSGQDLSQIDFPAGIAAENLLVVGSISEKGEVSSFSNIPSGGIRTVFFPGQNQACIFPQDMLIIPEKYLNTLPALLDDLLQGNESYQSVASYLLFLGNKRQLLNDGTSFSTAISANACAKLWIENKKLSPNEIINELIKNSHKISQVSF